MGYQEEMYPTICTWEHLNHVCKEAIRGLGVNKTDKAISRVSKSLGTLSPILDQFDEVNDVHNSSSIHSAPSSVKDRDMIIKELLQSHIFTEYSVLRTHPAFPQTCKMFYVRDFFQLTK